MTTRLYALILILAANVPASADTVTLDSLLGTGGTIVVGSWTFSNFEQTLNNATGMSWS